MRSGVSRRRSARVRALGSVENRDPLTRLYCWICGLERRCPAGVSVAGSTAGHRALCCQRVLFGRHAHNVLARHGNPARQPRPGASARRGDCNLEQRQHRRIAVDRHRHPRTGRAADRHHRQQGFKPRATRRPRHPRTHPERGQRAWASPRASACSAKYLCSQDCQSRSNSLTASPSRSTRDGIAQAQSAKPPAASPKPEPPAAALGPLLSRRGLQRDRGFASSAAGRSTFPASIVSPTFRNGSNSQSRRPGRVQFKVAAASGKDERSRDRRSPDNLLVDQPLDMLNHRIAVIAGFAQRRVCVGAHHD